MKNPESSLWHFFRGSSITWLCRQTESAYLPLVETNHIGYKRAASWRHDTQCPKRQSFFKFVLFSPFFPIFLTTFSRNFCSFRSVSSITTVSYAYLILLKLYPPIISPSRTSISLKIASLKNLNRSAEKTHLSITPLLIFVFLVNSCFYPYGAGLIPIYILDFYNMSS